ncbi:MAG TPA: DUF3168 domain-containing protein [Acidobacteriaceae bacterium]|nr:DUF3168 domain-containing protein [Acidobacteriaceae bacterium]
MIEAGITAFLQASSALAALVGTRIYPTQLPDSTVYPAITYQMVGGNSKPTLDTSGVQKLRMQFDCWSAATPDGGTYAQAASVREALIAALNGVQTTLSDGTRLLTADLVNPGMSFFEREALQYRCMVEFYLLYTFQ